MIVTTFIDNQKTKKREAWQQGKIACYWGKEQIDVMHMERPEICPAWGIYAPTIEAMLKHSRKQGKQRSKNPVEKHSSETFKR